MLCYCKKCGRIVYFMLESDDKICDCCKSTAYPVPNEYLDCEFSVDPNKEEEFIEKYIKPSPEFDPYLFEHRDEILARENMKLNAALAHGASILEEQSRVPKCPTCGSLNVEKISTGKKIFGGAMFGLFSSDVRNTMRCKNCGAKW